MRCWPRRSAIRNPSRRNPRRRARRERDPRRSARPKSKEFAVNLRRQTSQRSAALHHPAHRRMLPVLHYEPLLRPASLIGPRFILSVAKKKPNGENPPRQYGMACRLRSDDWISLFMVRRALAALQQLDLDQGGGLPAPGVAASISERGKRGDDQSYACLPGIASLKMARRRTKTGPVQNVTTNSSRRALLCLESVPCRIVAGVHPSSGFSL